MSGNTGRMTRQQIRKRGPRLVLARLLLSSELIIYREGQHPEESYTVLAKSYSESYLERIAEAERK